MRVFVTGATGFVGSTIVSDLLSAGYKVTGLTRSDEGAKALIALGASAHKGDLEDHDSLRIAAAKSDAVIHAGFNHDFANFAKNCAADREAIEVIGEVFAGSDRPFVVTAGLPLTPGRATTEQDPAPSSAGGSPRVSEQTALRLLERGVYASVVRMSQVHDQDKQGLATYMIALAKQKGISAYVGDGLNRWSAVHRKDAASIYRYVLEEARAGGVYHAVAEQEVTTRDIAEAIGIGLKLPIVSLSVEKASDHFGWLGVPVSMDAPATSVLTRKELGWSPKEDASFIADLMNSTLLN